MKKAELIFIPSPGAGHLLSAVEFCKRLIARDARFSITILTINSPYPAGTSTNQTTSTSIQGLRYISLPQVEPPPPEITHQSIENYISIYISHHKTHVKDAITSLHNSSSDPVHLAGLVVDMFCTSLIDLADELGIPSYVFFTSGAAFLGLLFHLPARYDRLGVAMFDESEPETIIPSFQNSVPSWGLPSFAFNRVTCTAFMNHARRFKETKGIIVNTFAELEPYAIKSLADGYPTIPVYTVGPVLDLEGENRRPCDPDQRARIMKWLDVQPENSVVFLCFGNAGSFKEDQVREIATGLSRSGQRFLWSLRKPPTGAAKRPTEYSVMEIKNVLPDDFWALVEEGRGLVCGWAPQVEILAHKGIGSFVSHCGWNSSLESLWFGKPIVAWPLYAEQHMNAFELVSELNLAVTNLGYRPNSGGVVTANEVERAIRSVMDKENPVRSRVKEMVEISRCTLMDGGSSFDSIECLIRDIMGNKLECLLLLLCIFVLFSLFEKVGVIG